MALPPRQQCVTLLLGSLCVSLVLLSPSLLRAFAVSVGLTDTLSHPAPTSGTYAYNSYHGPAAGQSYVDPIFGSTVRRVTGDGQQDDIYASNMHWNADETRYIHGTK